MQDTITIHQDITKVTILILVEGSLQYIWIQHSDNHPISHNPYFSRRFFAMHSCNGGAYGYATSQSLF